MKQYNKKRVNGKAKGGIVQRSGFQV